MANRHHALGLSPRAIPRSFGGQRQDMAVARNRYEEFRSPFTASPGVCSLTKHSIGLLMMATIPLIQFTDSDTPSVKSDDITLYPSSEHPAQGMTRVFTRFRVSTNTENTPPTRFFDPFSRDGQDIPFGSYNHIDFLDRKHSL